MHRPVNESLDHRCDIIVLDTLKGIFFTYDIFDELNLVTKYHTTVCFCFSLNGYDHGEDPWSDCLCLKRTTYSLFKVINWQVKISTGD